MAVGSVLLSGCSAEAANPLGTENIGGSPTRVEALVRDLDARGVLNGQFNPNDVFGHWNYPIQYVGSWTIVQNGFRGEEFFTAVSDHPGDRVSIVATFSRAVIEFYDWEMYRNPGTIGVTINGESAGTFELARRDEKGMKILEYVVTNPDPDRVATVTMTLVRGSVAITGYWLVYPWAKSS